MDPNKTVDLLGTGGSQVILAVCVVALAAALVFAVRALIQSYNDRLAEQRAVIQQRSDDTRNLMDSFRDMKSTVDLALAALKGRS